MKRLAAALDKTSPGTDYALIYLNSEGKVKVEESAYFLEQKSTIFTPKVRQNFLEILGGRIDLTSNVPPRRVRPRRSNAPGSETPLEDVSSDSDDCSSSSGSNNMVPLVIGDTAQVLDYYRRALTHFQQLNCRVVAKAFIKFIEPRKQVRYPYNGGKPPAGSPPGTTGDPEKTKPEWWPPSVMHKEPDHLRKEYRIELLLHIIRKLGNYGVTADKLKEVAGDTKRSLKHPSYVDIIYEILCVRDMEEQFERGEVDANQVVYVMNRKPSPSGEEEEDSNEHTVPMSAVERPEPMDEGLLTPASMDQSAPLMSSIHPMSTTTAAQPLQTSFSVRANLGPGSNSPRQPFYHTTPPHSTQSSSQLMPSTPITRELIRPHNVLFGDPSPSPFPGPLPDQECDKFVRTSRQALFEDYDAPPVPGCVPQPVMPTPFPAQPHYISHRLEPLKMSQCALPLYTGPLAYPSYALQPSHPACVPVSTDGQARSEAIPSNNTAECCSQALRQDSSFYHAIR